MTVSVPEATYFSYVTDGVTTAFSFPLRFLSADDLIVETTIGGVTSEVSHSLLTITGAGLADGGTVTFLTAPAAGTLTIRRDTAAKQVVDLENLTKSSADSVETQLDRLAMVQQDRDRDRRRAWLSPVGQDGGYIVAGAEGTVPKFDADGNLIEGPSAAEIESAEGYAAAAAQSATDASDQADRAEEAKDGAEAAKTAAQAAASSVSPTEYPNIATAEALAPISAPNFIRTAGYSAAGDGGGALYKKVDTEPSHAGKFSITLSDGTTVVWYELADTVVSILSLGASTAADDNYDAAQAALDIGRAVYIPSGTFNYSETLRPVGDQEIFGAGKRLSVLHMTTVNKHGMIIDRGSDRCRLHDFEIGGIRQNNGAEYDGVRINDVDGTLVERVCVDGADDAGIRIGYDDDTGAPEPRATSTNTRVLNCDVYNVTNGSGIEIIGGVDALVQGNFISQVAQHGIRLCAGTRCKAIGNTIEHFGNTGAGGIGIRLQAGNVGADVEVLVPNVDNIVTDNIIRLLGDTGAEDGGSGKRTGIDLVSDIINPIIANNRIEMTDSVTGSTRLYGIYIGNPNANLGATYSTEYPLISGNILTGEAEAGIFFEDGALDVNVRGNIINMDMNYGIRVNATGEQVTGIISGNLIRGATLVAIRNNTNTEALKVWGNDLGGGGYSDIGGGFDPGWGAFAGTITRSGNTLALPTTADMPIETGDRIQFTTTGILPAGLSVDTDYYAIRQSANTFSASSSLSDAIAGTAVTLTSAGTGTHTVVSKRRIWANA